MVACDCDDSELKCTNGELSNVLTRCLIDNDHAVGRAIAPLFCGQNHRIFGFEAAKSKFSGPATFLTKITNTLQCKKIGIHGPLSILHVFTHDYRVPTIKTMNKLVGIKANSYFDG